jgi:hypothetical protein
MIEVIAPSALLEGYQFEAQLPHNNKKFTVAVPPGESKRLKDSWPVTVVAAFGFGIMPKMIIPVGHWRDDLFDFFSSSRLSLQCFELLILQIIIGLRLT